MISAEEGNFEVEFVGVSKRFGRTLANAGISLGIEKGTIHALLGENGAGKSTAVKLLAGLLQPDEGRIKIEGRDVRIASPRMAQDLGIGMVHQHFSLVDELTVVENLLLGKQTSSPFLGRREQSESLKGLCSQLEFELDPTARVGTLEIGTRQRLEVLRILNRNARILILDEPTSILTAQEVVALFKLLRRLRDEGRTILLITHKLKEVMEVANNVTVLKKGQIVATLPISETSVAELASLMVGSGTQGITDGQNHEKTSSDHSLRPSQGTALKLNQLHVHSSNGSTALRNLTLEVRFGEILGIAGISGNGQRELAEAIAGLRSPSSGTIHIGKKDISNESVSSRCHRYGLRYVPAERQEMALLLDNPIRDNAILRDFSTDLACDGNWLNNGRISSFASKVINGKKVAVEASIRQKARELSGGNQQRLVLSRELTGASHARDGLRLLVAEQPCQGLDIRTTSFVHALFRDLRAEGKAVLYISTELDHLLEVCNRIAVLADGQLSAIVPSTDDSRQIIGELMGGDSRLTVPDNSDASAHEPIA